jgi:hypothetical protein
LDSPASLVQKIQAHLKVLPSITFEDFHSAQPSWTRRLLSYPTIHHHLHASTSPLAVSDGSVQLSHGTFGWVLVTTQPPHQLLHFSGPAFDASMDSYRADAYSLLSLATLLNIMSKFFHSRLPPTTIWCNNLSVVQTINSITTRLRPVFPIDPSTELGHYSSNLSDFSSSSCAHFATCEGQSRLLYPFLESPP